MTVTEYFLHISVHTPKLDHNKCYITDVMGGHDIKDSTTVTDEFNNFTLPDDISVKNLHIGIPKV